MKKVFSVVCVICIAWTVLALPACISGSSKISDPTSMSSSPSTAASSDEASKADVSTIYDLSYAHIELAEGWSFANTTEELTQLQSSSNAGATISINCSSGNTDALQQQAANSTGGVTEITINGYPFYMQQTNPTNFALYTNLGTLGIMNIYVQGATYEEAQVQLGKIIPKPDIDA